MNKFKILIYSLISIIFIIASSLMILLLVEEWNNPKVFWSVFTINWVITIGFSIFILNSKRKPAVKSCWLAVIIIFQILGVLFFTIFGLTPFKLKNEKDKNNQVKMIQKYIKQDQSKKYFEHQKINALDFLSVKNDIVFIRDNTFLYKETIQLLLNAKKTIHIQTYILRKGLFFNSIYDVLVKKIQEGVKIKIIYDWVGSFLMFPKRKMRKLKKLGAEIAIFNPKGINMFKGATNFRSHKKLIIVDNKIGIYGSSNIADDYLSINPATNFWRDINFIIKGELVNSLNASFFIDWYNYTNKQRHDVNKKELTRILSKHNTKNILPCQLIQSSPDSQQKNIENKILELIFKAKNKIKIITPYLFLTDAITQSLLTASERGVKIEILLPGKKDNKNFILDLNRQTCFQLSDSRNIHIYEYNGFVHSKLFLIDDDLVYTGTFNLDNRSMWINFENSILIFSKNLNKELTMYFNEQLKNSIFIDKEFLRKRSTLLVKTKLLFLNLFYPLL